MGLIVNDNMSLNIGTNKVQCYLNIGTEPIIVNKNPLAQGLYNITVNFCIYFDHESYLKNGGCIDKKKITISVSSADLSQNLYELLYNNVKNNFSSYINI